MNSSLISTTDNSTLLLIRGSGIESECGGTRLFVWLTVTDVPLDCPSPTPPAAASLNCWVPVTPLSNPGLGLCGTAGCGSFHLGSLRPAQHTSEPRLYRKTFLLRKRGSQPKLQASSVPAIPGEESSVSTPTSLGEGGAGGGTTGTGGSQESVKSGVRPRLQRQMAQSRKTFRFRKSKHGHSEPGQQERQPQVAHIDVEPTRVPPVTATQKPPSVAGEDPALRELSVPVMTEDEFTPQNHTAKREKPKASLVQTEPESVSEVSFMETSNISGYRESFGGFDMSLQELERLEMQVRSGKYKEPLVGPAPPPTRKISVVETRFHAHPISHQEHRVDMTSPNLLPSQAIPRVPTTTTGISEKAQLDSCKTSIPSHSIDSLKTTSFPVSTQHPAPIPYPVPAPHATHSIPTSHYATVSHSPNSVSSSHHPTISHLPHSLSASHHVLASHSPHSSILVTHDAHSPHSPHTHHSVHFSDMTYESRNQKTTAPKFTFPPTTSQAPPTSHVVNTNQTQSSPVPPSIAHEIQKPCQPIYSDIHGQVRPVSYSIPVNHPSHIADETHFSSIHTNGHPSQVLHSVNHGQEIDLTVKSGYDLNEAISIQPTVSHAVVGRQVVHVPSAHIQHPSQHMHTLPHHHYESHAHHTDYHYADSHHHHHHHHQESHQYHEEDHLHDTEHCSSRRSQHQPIVPRSQQDQPTVWRHSWTEGEAREARVWSGQESRTQRIMWPSHTQDRIRGTRQGWEGPEEVKTDNTVTSGELTSLLRRLERRTPSEQSLLVAERDEDTLI
ncbi:hypothetical protein Pcinc_006714 [Petrolisthes cinctipes]|uniref:Uncharacterized protein n=1 Tax=Petrolisthes cinctipes TaxID=88211 RepID=A0AAE1KY36_PETCI|nr:hypothetical protein Pcinc_006714 [Petrolisthes cinctipes]